MKNGRCRSTEQLNCQSGPEGIEKLAQVDLWETDKFDKFEWEDAYFARSDAGVVKVLGALRRSVGQIAARDHVPVVWRRGSDVQRELGVSADGYWGPLKRAVDAGLVVKVNQHGVPGRRKLLVFKLPEESAFHAVARAKGTVERYLQKNPSVPRWVLRALRVELDDRIAAASAEFQMMHIGRCEPAREKVGESLMCRDSNSGSQRSNLCLAEIPTYREQEFNGDFSEVESRRRAKTESPQKKRRTPSSTPPPKEERSEEIEESTAATLPKKYQALRAFLSNLFSRCGLAPKEASLDVVAESYVDALGDSEQLRHELKAKIMRLNESEFAAGKIVGFLLEDCPALQPKAEAGDAQTDQSEERDELETVEVEWKELEEIPEFEVVRNALRKRVSTHNYQSWLAATKLICVGLSERVEIIVRDEFLKAWIEEQYIDLLKDTVEELLGRCLEVVVQTRGTHVIDAPAMKHAAYEARL